MILRANYKQQFFFNLLIIFLVIKRMKLYSSWRWVCFARIVALEQSDVFNGWELCIESVLHECNFCMKSNFCAFDFDCNRQPPLTKSTKRTHTDKSYGLGIIVVTNYRYNHHLPLTGPAGRTANQPRVRFRGNNQPLLNFVLNNSSKRKKF